MAASLVGTAQSGGGGTSASRSWNHTIASSPVNPVLVIALINSDVPGDVSALTIDTIDKLSLFACEVEHATWGGAIRVWVVPALAAGVRAIVATLTGSPENWYVSQQINGVDQASPVRDFDSARGNNSTAQTLSTPAFDSSVDDVVLSLAVADSVALAITSGQSTVYLDSSSDGKAVGAKAGSAPTAVGQVDFPAAATYDYCLLGLSLRAASTGPVPTSVSPNHGLLAGGNDVTITGTAFDASGGSAEGVTFGGSAATNVNFVNATTITCRPPAHAAGVVNVVVTNGDGSTGTLVGGYTYKVGPAVSPSSGTTDVLGQDDTGVTSDIAGERALTRAWENGVAVASTTTLPS